MDRTIVYPGSLPQDIDILQPQRNAMVALGMLAFSTLAVGPGSTPNGTICSGLACNPTATPSMNVVISQGAIISYQVVDQNAYGSLPADSTDGLVKIGINVSPTTMPQGSVFVAPTTAGQSQNFLIQAAFSETDGNAIVLPYLNAANTSQPYSGPSGSNTAQNTTRAQTVTLQVKAGAAATTGSQATPAPDSGFVGLWVVTIANGQTTITTSNIVAAAGAPFIPARIGPGMMPGFSNSQIFGTPGSFVFPVPVGVTKIRVTVVGAGAGGGHATTTVPAAGGSAGGAARGIYSVVAGTQYAVTVGAGGAGATVAGNAGSAGGSSSFGSLLSATGAAAGSPLYSGGAPGVGSGGTILNIDGGAGADAPGTSNILGGCGGNSIFGGAGRMGTGAGGGGAAPGAGGGGTYGGAPGNGGNGAPGIVIVEW